MKLKILAIVLIFLFLIGTNSVMADTVSGGIKKSKSLLFSFTPPYANYAIATNMWNRAGSSLDANPIFRLSEKYEKTKIDKALSSTMYSNGKNVHRISFYEQKQKTDSLEFSPSLAEVYLKQLAEKLGKRSGGKIVAGIVSLGGGVLCGALGTHITFSEEYDEGPGGPLLMGVGAGFIATGISILANANLAKRLLGRVESISDYSQREIASQKALSSLSSSGRTFRIFISATCATAAALALLVKESNITMYGNKEGRPMTLYISAGFLGATAAYILFWRTPEENAYKNYLKESKQRGELGLRIGTGPYGGVRIGLVLSF